MGLFSFLRKPKYKLADSLIPKSCLTPIPSEISSAIDKIEWADFETAYGNAKNTIPFYLKNLFCVDKEIAMDATHQLWCSLCHQHAFISSASLPAYEILKIGLLKLDDKLKIEILDIFQGFLDCTSEAYFSDTKQPPEKWELELRQRLMLDINIFSELTANENEEISHFASSIYKGLLNAS